MLWEEEVAVGRHSGGALNRASSVELPEPEREEQDVYEPHVDGGPQQRRACVRPPFTSRWTRRMIEAEFAALTIAITAIERRRLFA